MSASIELTLTCHENQSRTSVWNRPQTASTWLYPDDLEQFETMLGRLTDDQDYGKSSTTWAWYDTPYEKLIHDVKAQFPEIAGILPSEAPEDLRGPADIAIEIYY